MSALAILSIIEAALAGAPKAIELISQLKSFVSALFTAGLINKAEQDAIHAYVDARAAMAAAGITPDHWKVEPDPVV